MDWFLHNVPPRKEWFLGFKTNDTKKLRNFFVVQLPSGEAVNAWVPEASAPGSEVVVQIGDSLHHNVKNKASKPVAMTYKGLRWNELHMLCLERGLKPFGSGSDLRARLKKLDQQISARKSLKHVPQLRRLSNPQAKQILPVKLIALAALPGYYADESRFRKMPYEAVLAQCSKYEVINRRVAKSELVTRLCKSKQLVDRYYADLYRLYQQNQLRALVNVPLLPESNPAPQKRLSIPRLSWRRSSSKNSSSYSTSYKSSGVSSSVVDLPNFADIDVDGSGTISAEELQLALTRDGEVPFQLKTCKLLISMVDSDGNDEIDRHEFPGLLEYLTGWQNTFQSYDTDASGTIELNELKHALESNGYEFSDGFFMVLVHSYDTEGKNALNVDEFIQLFCDLTALTRIFVGNTPNMTTAETASFSHQQYMSKLRRYAGENQLESAFAMNENSKHLGHAKFGYEHFLYYVVSV